MFSSDKWFGAEAGFYNSTVTQSLRFDDGSSAYMSRTPSGAGNQQTWTWSGWVKKTQASTSDIAMFSANGGGDTWFLIGFSGSNTGIDVDWYNGSTRLARKFSNAVFRDPSAWYHVVVAVDTTKVDSDADDRIKVYINSEQITSWSVSTNPSKDSNTYVNSTNLHTIGKNASTSRTTYFDGYLAEVNLVDGSQLAPTSFGETKNGVWIPKKYSGSYGTNGFRLQFNQTGVGTASTSTIGADTSGNTHHFTSSGIVASDCNMPDSPENNFATLNPLHFLTASTHLSEGNLKLTYQSTAHRANIGSMLPETGKWYFEVYNTTSASSGTVAIGVGLQDTSKPVTYATGADNYVFYSNNNNARFQSNTTANTLSTDGTYTPGAGAIIQVAYDADSGKIFIGLNNTYIASDSGSDGDPSGGNNPTATLSTSINYLPFVGVYNNVATANFGQDSSFAGDKTSGSAEAQDGNGIGDFYYAPPSGFLALCSANLPEPTISPNAATQAVDHFGTLTYSSDGNSVDIISGGNDNNGTAVGGEINFSPDWVWIKRRNNANNHQLFDTNRGQKVLQSNETDDESDYSAYFEFLSSSNGFRLPAASANMNANGGTYVAWNWKANGATTSSDSNGSITSTVQANTDAGFSIVTYAGTGASSATIGHGLGAVPKQIWVKNRDAAYNWKVYHAGNTTAPETDYLVLDSSNKTADAVTHWNDTAPTSTVFSIGSSNALIRSGDNFVAYCFADVEGYSKFGSYTGNLDTNGAFVYTGFRPAFVLIKNADEDGYNWYMYDNARLGYNPNSIYSLANTAGTETNYSGDSVDFLSNGFKLRTLANGRGTNRNANHVYMAFAEAPFKYANAR